MFLDRVERINGISPTFGHLVSFGIKNQSVGNNIFEGHGVEYHRGDSMQREEPTAGLIHSLGDEIGREMGPVVDQFFILERVVYLSVRHSSRVKPDVDQVFFANHPLSRGGYQYNIIHIRAMQVDFLVVFFRVIAYLEILERVFGHHACLYGFFDFFH